jgi:DNA repair exonuclease SbcCD nuclease subunit
MTANPDTLPADVAVSFVRPSVLVLHTSDVHIGEDDGSHAALHAVVDTALAANADLVIIAGDLFDHDRVSDAAAARVITELARLHQPTLIIPGNHDSIDERSIYLRVDLTQAGSHVVFIGDPAGTEVIFEDLSVAIWARGIEIHTPENRPLEGYRPSDSRFWRLAVAHGHYVATGERSERSSLIRQDEIAALECDYLALGHWHHHIDVSAGGVTASYSGSPSEGRAPGVNLVRLDPQTGVRIERVLIDTGKQRRGF